MKAIKIKNAGQSFGMFLISNNIPFMFYEAYYILNTRDIDKFKAWCLRHGMSISEIEQMDFSVATIEDGVL